MTHQLIMLRNLNCPTCAAKLERAARNLPGMERAQVAFGSGTLSISYDEQLLTQTQVEALIRRMGVEVAAVMAGPQG